MDIRKIALNLVKKSKTPLLGSVSQNGFPNIKAMLKPRARNELKEFYFSTNTSSMRVSQYLNNEKACIYFFDNTEFIGLMITGTVEIIQDQNMKNKIWNDGDEIYYSLGVTDPDYCVLKFVSSHARLYNKMKVENFTIQ